MTMPLAGLAWLVLAGLAQAPQGRDLDAVAARALDAPPAERGELAAALRSAGPAGGVALLDACLDRTARGVASPPGALDLLFELCPASQSARVGELRPHLGVEGKVLLLRWIARRDLPHFRDFEQERARILIEFLQDAEALAVDAARRCASWDLAIVAAALRGRILAALGGDRPASRELLLELARSLAALRASAPHLQAVMQAAEEQGVWLVPVLLPGFAHRIDLVTREGSIDRWLRAEHPSLRQAFLAVVDRVDGALFRRIDHPGRLALYRRFRRADPTHAEWAIREAHVAVMDLASAGEAAPALRSLERMSLTPGQRVETWLLRATADFLAGRDPAAALRRAEQLAASSWSEEPSENLFGGFDDDLELHLSWRRQVPPAIGEDEITLRRRRFRDTGGTEGADWRTAGRRQLAVLLVGHLLWALRGDASRASSQLDQAIAVYRTLEGEWDHYRHGESGDLEAALAVRCGPLEVLGRALEGNEWVASRLPPSQRAQRLAWAEQGFASLIEGLAVRLPDRVLPLPRAAVGADPPESRERPFLDLTGAFARFLQRIGEEDKAAAILDHLIERLKGSGNATNERRWANYLFDRASIAIDRRNPRVARTRLNEYVRYYERSLRDVRLNPDRYYAPDAVREWCSSRLAQGYISLAVLHNVVLHEVDTARGHCRRAYALDDSPFNRVLYACYLARDGRKKEALELLATVDPDPSLYYNMACTHALSDDPEKALEYLELDLSMNHATRKARNRQRDWAAGDRDLASLRRDPRFLELVRQRGEGEEK